MKALGQYRPIAKLGLGGMAEVRLALAQRAGGFNKLLVLKLLREELCSDAEFCDMFLAEAKVAALLNHPNIVQTNEIGNDAGRYFMAMEYLEGQPLSALLARVGRANMPIDVHVFVLAQVLHGLHYAHGLAGLDGKTLQIIHRDVSPHNVFVTYTGQVKLLDFGIAKIAGAASMTRTGVLKGKLGYMAPEQAAMSSTIDRRADIFAVGVMLWEAIAKERFVAKNEEEAVVLHRRLANEDRKLADFAAGADPKLVAICEKAVAHDPADRWDDAQSFAEALEEWLPTSKSILEKQLATMIADTFRQERSKIRRVIEEASSQPADALTTTSPDLGKLLASMETSASRTGDFSAGSGASGVSVTKTESPSTLKRLLVVALVAAAGVGAVMLLRKPPAPAKVDPPVVEPVATKASLRVRVTPATAKITVDDGAPSTGTFDGQLPKDSSHKLKIAAEGYEPEERTVTLDRDADITVVLRPIPAAQPSATANAAGRPQQAPPRQPTWAPPTRKPDVAPTPEPAPTPTVKRPKNWIDESDPYAKP